jgi:hypothetical protein
MAASGLLRSQAIVTAAAGDHANPDIAVAGRAWLLPIPGRSFTSGQIKVFLPSGQFLAAGQPQRGGLCLPSRFEA